MPARYKPFAAVLLNMLLCMTTLHFRAAFVLAVNRLVTAVSLVFLESMVYGVRLGCLGLMFIPIIGSSSMQVSKGCPLVKPKLLATLDSE